MTFMIEMMEIKMMMTIRWLSHAPQTCTISHESVIRDPRNIEQSGNWVWQLHLTHGHENIIFKWHKKNSIIFLLGLWMWRTRRVDENRLVTCLCWRKGLTSPVWIDLLEEKSFSPSDSCGNIKSNFTEMDISCQEFHKIRLKCNKCYFLWVI